MGAEAGNNDPRPNGPRDTQSGKAIRQIEEEILEEILPEAFALVREAAGAPRACATSTCSSSAACAAHGKIAEMKTGEGKTLVATLPLYLNALTGRGVHLVTPNDYLSKVGVQWMGPVYHLLGLQRRRSSSPPPAIPTTARSSTTRTTSPTTTVPAPAADHAPRGLPADITYGTNNEFGFDYLRDNMVQDLTSASQRELNYAIVDEVDNILIDEARTPLIISRRGQESSDWYTRFAELVAPSGSSSKEADDGDYMVDEKDRLATLTEEGIERIEDGWASTTCTSPSTSS